MVNYWIFVSVPFTDFNTGTIQEMFRKVENSKRWRIGRRTPNRGVLSAGDKILFYQGGEEGRKIVGAAELASGLEQSEGLDSYVKIKSFVLWKNPVDIRTLINELSFIKRNRYWGVYFQGGVV